MITLKRNSKLQKINEIEVWIQNHAEGLTMSSETDRAEMAWLIYKNFGFFITRHDEPTD